VADERLAAPVLGDVAKQAVLDLVPLCALRRCTDVVGANPTRQLSLQPEAPGADQEATNDLKHFGKRSLLGISGLCGPQRERTSSRPRKDQCGSQPASGKGEAAAVGQASEICSRRSHRGKDGSTYDATSVRNKGSLSRSRRSTTGSATANPRGLAPAGADGGWVRMTWDAG